MISLTCDYHPGAPDDATIHHVREILSSGTHVSSSQKNEKGWSHFWPKVRGKNWNYLFYPSAKSCRELKIKTLGVTFRGASAYYVQKSIAPQKQAVCRFSDDFFFLTKIFIKKFCQKNVFGVQKWNVGNRLKRVFPKFEAERSHPRGVNGRSKFYKNSAEIFRFRRKYDAIIRARGFQNWQKWPLIFCSIIRGGRMIRQLIIRNQPLSSGFSLIMRPYLQAWIVLRLRDRFASFSNRVAWFSRRFFSSFGAFLRISHSENAMSLYDKRS